MKTNRFNRLWFIVLSLIIISGLALAQETDSVDERVWSITHWLKWADQGLVTFTPADETAFKTPPQTPDSRIYARSVLTDDSPDVRVTPLTNVTQSEVSVFINPNDDTKLLNSNNSSDLPVSTIFGTSYWISDDGGLTWTGSEQGAGGTNRGDPATGIDLNNRYYIGYIASNDGQGVAHSTDEGQTWTQVQVANATGGLLDKNHMWVDHHPGSPYANNLYSAWTDFGSANTDVMLSRSTDGGLTWSSPVNVSNGLALDFNQGVNIQCGPNGEVYVAWVIYDSFPADDKAIGFSKSLDGGVTWSTPVRIIDNIRGLRSTGLGGGKSMRVSSFPSMTVNQNDGTVYVVWPNIGVPGVNTGDPDIYMIKSSDGGSTWSTPSRVNQDAQGNGKDQWYPWIACDPSTGFLVCIFFDSRNYPGNDMAETFVATSTDNGNSWEDFKVSDVAWTGDGFSGFASGYAGDYIGIDILNGKVYPMWADVRGGQLMTWVSPFLLADPTDPNPPSNFEAYSDYTTPTSMELTWSDPTTLANGDTLLPADFQINILRDDVAIDSVAGGTEQYTDVGLTDGVSYTYTVYTQMLTNDSTSLGVNATWTAGGAKKPEGPTSFFITQPDSLTLMMHWTNPSENVDGTPMDDFDGINLYEDGSLVMTYSRSGADTGRADSASYTPPAGTHQYYVTAFDNESPSNESNPSNTAYSPIAIPFYDDFPVVGLPNPGYWLNNLCEVTTEGDMPPSPPNVLNLDGDPSGGGDVALLPVDLSGMGSSGILLAYWWQPEGLGDTPEAGDDLFVDFRNDLGTWVQVRHYVGTPNQPFQQEVIDIASENPGSGATFFHPSFQFRFRNTATSGAFDDWNIDNVFLGLPNADPQMVTAPSAIGDTLLVGATAMHSIEVSNQSPLPATLMYTVTEDPPSNWLTVTPSSGSVASGQTDMLDVTLDASSLAAGNYSADVIISGNDPANPEDTVSVILQVNDAPVISVLPDTFDITIASNDSMDANMTIHNSGLGPLTFELIIGGNLPELMYYKFDEVGANQTENFAAPGSPAPATAGVLGGLTMGGTGYDGAALIGAGGPSSSDYVNTGWITNISGSWTISMWLSGTWPSSLSYLFGDITAQSFRCFTAGAAGVNGLLLRSPNGGSYDVQLDNVGPGTAIVDYVYDDAALEIRGYVNGVLMATVPQNAPIVLSGSDVFKVAGYSTSTGLPAGMLMDEWKWYTRAIDLDTKNMLMADFWLSADTTSGIIAPGDSMQIALTFNSSGLSDGDYETEILINSNDPINPEEKVGVHMRVAGGPAISLSTDSISFDTTYVGFDSTASFFVENIGSDTLQVSDIQVTGSAFSVDTSMFMVPPSGSQEVQVTFTPPAQGEFSGLIRCISNDPVNDTLDIALWGYGDPPVGVDDLLGLPKTFAISPNYPNPFNPTTNIKYQLPQASDVSLFIYNILGQKVRTLINSRVEAGYHSVEWDGRNDAGARVGSGVYIYRFRAADFHKVRTMILMK